MAPAPTEEIETKTPTKTPNKIVSRSICLDVKLSVCRTAKLINHLRQKIEAEVSSSATPSAEEIRPFA